MTAIAVVSLLVTYLTTGVAWTFIVMYHVMSRGAWRHDPMGRHLMALAGVDAGIFSMLTVATIWPPLAVSPAYQWSYLAMVSGISTVTAWRGVILWRLYRERVQAATTPRRRLEHPILVWQSALAVAQVAVAEFVPGPAGGKVALAIGTAQVALGFYAYGRARAAATPATE